MDYLVWKYAVFAIILLQWKIQLCHCEYQDVGSCDFEGSDWLCGYIQSTNDNFNWAHFFDNVTEGHYMLANTANRVRESTAQLITLEIKQQETHCVTFKIFVVEQEATNSSLSSSSARLNVYLKDNNMGTTRQPVWNSDHVEKNSWITIQLALTPRAYQIVFEAVALDSRPGSVAIDDVFVSTSACESAPYFLRLGAKSANTGQNVTLQCLLWGHSGQDTKVILQKSTGKTILPASKEVQGDHLSVYFSFTEIGLSDAGKYRCVSGNSVQVGVSNYAKLSVYVPPVPKRGPKVVKPGSTKLVIQLNADNYTGDGPVVEKRLIYRPVEGSWSDVHHITTPEYQLWHLQPDTEYELAVTLVRPGPGGTGVPGPKLRKKTKCGPPKTTVQNVKLTPLTTGEDSLMRVEWDAPDFSVTQCHNYAFVVKYRLFSKETGSSMRYQSKRVEKEDSLAIISNLKPYTTYQFKVELTNSAESGSKETGEFTALTKEGIPGPVPRDSLSVVSTNETAISLVWAEPVNPNGKVDRYEISCSGENTFDPNFTAQNDSCLIEVKGDERQLVIEPLHPGTSYTISIRARTSAGYGPRVNISARTKIAPPTFPEYPPVNTGDNVDDNKDSVTPTTIAINIIPARSNGAPITGYYIIVADDTTPPAAAAANAPATTPKLKKKGKGRKRKKQRSRKERSVGLMRLKRQSVIDVSNAEDENACYSEPLTYEQAAKNNKPYYASGKLMADEVTQERKFVVGDNSPSNGFENPPLDPNKNYKIYIRVESEANGKKTVNCILVAVKNRALTLPTTTPSSTTTSILTSSDSGREDVNTTVLPPGFKEPSEQDRVMMYASIGGAVAGILIITLIIVLIVMRMRRKKHSRKDEVVNPFEVRMVMSDVQSPAHTLLPISPSENEHSDRQALMPDVVGYEHPDFQDKLSEGGAAAGGYGTSSNDERFAVRVDDFHLHVEQMKATGGYGFRDEFSAFPDRPSALWDVASRDENRVRNRYANIIAYDHSRVVLEPAPGHEEEFENDYINASYVTGYKNPSMYIATQAPTEETTTDFWWMVWQEKTTVIVMVTNLVEMGKRKCHKYWPDGWEEYGSLKVSLNKEENVADHVIRTFVLQQIGGYDVREVKQFHFTAWPDHGVPSRPTNLLSFTRKIKMYEPQGQGPTIVHCSAGAGRTGCFIVIDMMLDMAREEEVVDIHNTVRSLRAARVNMVQTEEQYVFIHEAVLEALLCGDTSVMAQDLAAHYDDLITVDMQTHFAPIQEEFETLNAITPKLTDDECSVARLPRNRASNRFMDVLPADRHLAYLVTPDLQDREKNYINAVYLDSYSRKNSFLVTQMPLPTTVVDIWRLVYDHNCTSIVMMNDLSEHDQTCAQYWPDNGSVILGPFTIELLTKDEEVDVVTRLFKVQSIAKTGEPYRLVQQFQLTNWPAAQPVPYSRNSILRVIQLVMKWQIECARTGGDSGQTLVHCVAGAGRSGTFVSCYNMCEQLRREYSADVFNIVQRLRNVRPQLVETLEQYRFCYEVGIEFAQPH